MRIGVRAGLLAASAIWAISPLKAQETQGAAPLADAETKGVVVAEADQRPVEVAQLFSAEHVTVSARRVDEDVQKVPVAISVVSDETIANTGAYNLNRLTQLQPSLQFYSSNPRNTSVNIRGIGAPLGLTNDGIEQGVGI
jgi:iron complex outermembrane receptor protein